MTRHVRGSTLRQLAWLLGRIAVAYLLFETLAVLVFRSHYRPAIGAIKRFNKRVLNPAMMRRAGRQHWYSSVVHHRGRTSGKEYATPIWAVRVGDAFYIPLPYGTDVDWVRNIQAAESCVVESDGVRYATTMPEIVPASEAAPRLPTRRRLTFGLYGVVAYLRLTIAATEATSGSAAERGRATLAPAA